MSNGVFTSNIFESGAPYVIIIEDGSSCDAIRLDGIYECPCNTESGSFVADPVNVCGTEFPELTFNNDQSLDENDVLQFVLHDGTADAIGNIISTSNTPAFSYTNELSFGTTYFVNAVVGTADVGGNVDFNDACASTSIGVPITFYEIPQAIIDQSQLVLSCETNQLQLDASASTNQNDLDYSWTTPNGRIVSGRTSAQPLVDQPGEYRLQVTHKVSGCTSETSVMVIPDEDLPIVQIATPEIITCDNVMILLDGTGSSLGNQFEYEWTVVSDGNILSGNNSLEVEVDAAGVYQLQITDTNKNCSSAATISVVDDVNPPLAEAGIPAQFSCLTTSVFLNGEGSSMGENYSYSWSTDDGNI